MEYEQIRNNNEKRTLCTRERPLKFKYVPSGTP